ncbi:unnamed protein product [Phyllotreta striolata]|uniref:Uncharacterized protein n=1 Tax=Phyllotreta striolata TaxID=444603 RepID=A0A9N9TVE8_PHYSR|nr:unnamed protein product [Phyllotreta striolata]
MSQSDSDNSLRSSSVDSLVPVPLRKTFYSNTSVCGVIDDNEFITDSGSFLTASDSQQNCCRTSSSKSFELSVDFSPQTLKDWLRLAKILISRTENPQNKHLIAKKTDELQDFFYFLAIEYFSTENFFEEFLEQKREEFIDNWQNVVDDCVNIFDLLLEVIDNIDLDNSFRKA